MASNHDHMMAATQALWGKPHLKVIDSVISPSTGERRFIWCVQGAKSFGANPTNALSHFNNHSQRI